MVSAQVRVERPFPGLRPFEEAENYLFFGRERQVDELLARLGRSHFLAVLGASGSGKSSLVRAGLLPPLHKGYLTGGGSHWRAGLMRPGESPIRNLAETLALSELPAQQEESERETSVSPQVPSHEEDLGMARLAPQENLLVVVDQFEELFRFREKRENRDEAIAFVQLLLQAAQPARIYVLLTMRSDFLGDCSQFRGLPEAINESQYLVPRLTREQLRDAITKPVALGGMTIAPRLVNRLLNEITDNQDQLPVFQHALMRTWDDWREKGAAGSGLDLGHYDAIGGMAGALSQHANEIYDGLTERGQLITEKLFKCSTEKGADNRGIRRPTALGEVSAV
ncbi:MAG: ATP-binding protein, partial [Cyanobacteria bacterium P01_H01_bin.15]